MGCRRSGTRCINEMEAGYDGVFDGDCLFEVFVIGVGLPFVGGVFWWLAAGNFKKVAVVE